MNNNLKWITAGALGLFAVQGYAQHSDITFGVDAGKLVIEADSHDHDDDDHDHGSGDEEHAGGLLTNNGKWLFEGDFGDFGQGPDGTDDPGFLTHAPNTMNAGEILGFEGVGSLQYWDGFTWSTATSATVTVEDAFGADTLFSSTGVTPGTSAVIDQVGSTGEIHAHISYWIDSGAATGAYAIEMALLGLDATGSSQLYTPSDSFYIVFNRGLSEMDYEGGVDALAAVPVPGAAVLMLSALSALGVVGARKRSQS